MTFDNPNSNIDPTLVATRSETKLVCNTCGSEMFKWSEKESATDEYFKQFLTTSEDRASNRGCGWLLLLASLWPLAWSVMSFYSFFEQGGLGIFQLHSIEDFWVSLLISIASLILFFLCKSGQKTTAVLQLTLKLSRLVKV